MREEMELLVARKLEEMKTRILSWDPDEYTIAFGQQLKRQQEKAKEEEMNAENSGNIISDC